MRGVAVVCAGCGTPFEKPSNEYRRQVNRGRTEFYCTLSCHAEQQHRSGVLNQDATHLNPANRRDHLTPFRWFLNGVKSCIHAAPRKGPTDLTPEFLRLLWEQQGGVCPFTGWPLQLPTTTRRWKTKNLRCASLDRIDSTQGYVQGNVRFIALMANLARSTCSDEDLVSFCKAVASFRA